MRGMSSSQQHNLVIAHERKLTPISLIEMSVRLWKLIDIVLDGHLLLKSSTRSIIAFLWRIIKSPRIEPFFVHFKNMVIAAENNFIH